MSFLNSPQWREFQENVGRKTFDIGKIGKSGYAIKMELPLGKSYLYSPSPDALENLEEIKKIAKKEGAVFFKWEPMVPKNDTNPRIDTNATNKLQKLGLQKAVKTLQPQRTVIIDIKKDENQILAQMHQKHRYNIRLAQRKGVEVKISDDKSTDLEKFWELMQKTTERDGFSAHCKDYYEKLLDIEGIELFFAYKDGKPTASAIIIFYENRATYLHGASDHELRKFMAPHLMHWEIIKHAKERDIEEYDLWGIDEKKWPGVTRFKRGFGGKEIEYIGSYDVPLQKLWYFVYKLKNKAR
ncbi:MAG: peptidoglycan bridge formation glycyltransferase FemA/FemB family protein [Candidatus Spechtbacterales bacterium]